MAQRRVRVGWIGAGRFSRSRLLPAFKRIPGVDLAVIANSGEESSGRVAQEFGFERTAGDWRQVIAATDVDAVVVGTQPPLHRELCVAALEAGKHVLTLNAISPTLEEAKDMARVAAQKPQLVNLVYPGQFYLRHDADMRALLQEGFVGEPLHVIDHWYTPFFGLGTQYEVVGRWVGEHKRVFAHRRVFEGAAAPAVPGRGPSRRELNVVVTELDNGCTVTYLHGSITTGLARIEVHGSQGRLVHYSEGQAQEGILGAKSGEADLRPVVPSAGELGPVEVEAQFIAAIRGELVAYPAVGSFADGARMMEFTQAWRASLDQGAWCDLPPR